MITKSIIIAISIINIIVASIVIYKQRRGKKVESKPNPFLFDIWFIAVNFGLSLSASICTITLSLTFAQKELANPWVASLMLITLQVAYISIKYFDAFTVDTENKDTKEKKVNWAKILFWMMFALLVVPASLENSEKFVTLMRNKMVQESYEIKVTDYQSQIDKLDSEISKWENKAKPLNAKLNSGDELTEDESRSLRIANYNIWKKGKDYDEAVKNQQNQDAAITQQNKENAEKKLQSKQNRLDFIFDALRILWAFLISILLELAAAWFTHTGSDRLVLLRIKRAKLLKKEENKRKRESKKIEVKKELVVESEDITISDQSVKEFTEIVREIKDNMEKSNAEITGDGNNIQEIIEEHTDIPIIVDEEPDQVNPELIKKLDSINDIKDLSHEIEFNDNWEITDDELVTNYNPESYIEKVESKENLDYNDYNKLVEKNSSKKEPVESGLGISKPVPVIQYNPKTSKKKVKETRIPIENILDDNEIYPQRNSVLKHKD